ncbi:lyase family protein, partial [Bacillus cereus]
ANPHHFIVGAQSSLPVDAAGNPWNGSWVYSHGNLISDLLDNVIKMGRTHLQDAVPIRLGQEFKAYSRVLERDMKRIKQSRQHL